MTINSNTFTACATVAAVKVLYLELAQKHFAGEEMAELNRQYRWELSNREGEVSRGDDEKDHTYKYNEETEIALIGFIQKLLSSGIVGETVQAYLIGTWVWIVGETKPIKDKLGKDGIGAKWHAKRSCWYFTPEQRRSFYSKQGLDGLAMQYGITALTDAK